MYLRTYVANYVHIYTCIVRIMHITVKVHAKLHAHSQEIDIIYMEHNYNNYYVVHMYMYVYIYYRYKFYIAAT